MKKAYLLLLLLTSLSLLDGTPIHRLHGKYVSTKNRNSLQLDSGSSSNVFTSAEAVADDSDDEDETLPIIVSHICFNGPCTFVPTVLQTPGNAPHRAVAVYKLLRDFRI